MKYRVLKYYSPSHILYENGWHYCLQREHVGKLRLFRERKRVWGIVDNCKARSMAVAREWCKIYRCHVVQQDAVTGAEKTIYWGEVK